MYFGVGASHVWDTPCLLFKFADLRHGEFILVAFGKVIRGEGIVLRLCREPRDAEFPRRNRTQGYSAHDCVIEFVCRHAWVEPHVACSVTFSFSSRDWGL